MSDNEDQDSMRFMIMLGKFDVPFESVIDECDEDNFMGACSSLEQAKEDAATDAACQDYGWHIIDNYTGHIYTDDGRVITDPPPKKRGKAYEIQ